MRLLQSIENIIIIIDRIYCCFFGFLSNQKNLCIIQYNSDIFYGICNPINDHNQRSSSCSKMVLFSLIILPLIGSFSFYSLKECLIFLIILSSDCFFIFSFLSTTRHIFDTFWFIIVLVLVCFKITHNFIFSTTQ